METHIILVEYKDGSRYWTKYHKLKKARTVFDRYIGDDEVKKVEMISCLT